MRLAAALLPILLFASSTASAQEARQRLLLAAEDLETRIKNTRWDYNHLGDKKKLEAELMEMNKIIEAVVQYESELRCPAFPGSSASTATDPEVQLIANIVHMRLQVNDTLRWNFNNLDQQKRMKEEIKRSEALLQELRYQHCH